MQRHGEIIADCLHSTAAPKLGAGKSLVCHSAPSGLSSGMMLRVYNVAKYEYGVFVLPSSGHSQQLQQHKLRELTANGCTDGNWRGHSALPTG